MAAKDPSAEGVSRGVNNPCNTSPDCKGKKLPSSGSESGGLFGPRSVDGSSRGKREMRGGRRRTRLLC